MAKNILFITSDQQHWMTLGVNNPEVSTPNLDRLAAEGIVFDRAYCTNPTCTPCRASMITGLYPSQHGAWTLGTKLPENVPTLGDYLKKADFKSALIGKAHFQPIKGTEEFSSIESTPKMQDLDYWRNFTGPFYGFDRIELARNHTDEHLVGQHYAIWMEEKGCPNWRDYFRSPTGNNDSQKWLWEIPEEFHYNTWIAERTNTLMEEYSSNGDKFLLWASFPDPHPPYLVPSPWDKMYDPEALTIPEMHAGEHEKNPPHFQMTQTETPDFSDWEEEGGNWMHGCHSHLKGQQTVKEDLAVYYGMVSMMDKYIGKILDKLEALGLKEETLIVFTTDHGHFVGQHGLVAKGPFHYEDMIKIPFIASQPGTLPQGQRSDAMQSIADLVPTFLDSVGLKIPRSITGINQLPVWKGEVDKVRDHIIVENRHQPTTMNLKTYVDERYKITVYYNREYGEMFDLETDPGEVDNLWNNLDFKDLKTDLLQKLIFAEMGKEPMWMPRVWLA